MKKIFTLVVIMFLGLVSFAQQDAMFTHYMFNTIAINPGYAGSRDALTITGLHRQQWVGFDGAPITQTVSILSPFVRQNIGLGVSFINDKIGPIRMTSFFVDFSYTIKVTKTSKLSFGIKGGTNMMRNDLDNIILDNPADPSFEGIQNQFLPNFGAGLYYHSDRWYLGVSVPKLLENDFDGATIEDAAGESRHYFLIAGTYFNLNESLKLKPTTFMKVTEAAPMEIDISAQLIFKDQIWAGLMYRTGDAFGAFVGVNLTPQLAVGYSFDWSMPNKTFVYNGGSHEIMVRYDFFFTDEDKIRSPRYF